MNPFRRFVSFGLSFLLAVGQPAEAIAASYVFRQPSAAGTYPIPTISNNVVTTGTYYKVDGKTYSISWQGSGGLAPYVIEIVSGNLPTGCPKPVQSGSVLSTGCVFASEGTWGGVIAQLTDANGMVVRDNAPNIVVTAPPPVLSAYSFPFSGNVGKVYTGTAKITGGRPPYAVSRSSGALPPGTSLTAVQDASSNWTATLSGTPTAIGSYTFDILVADVNGKSVTSSQINVNISYGAVSLALRPSKAAGVYRGVVGQPIKDSGVLVSGGTPPVVLSIQSGGLPAGLSIGQNGAVTGTPTASGSFTNIRAKAVDGATTPTTATSALFSFEIAKALNAFVLGGSDAYTVGKQIAPVSTATTGGTGPYTYALTGSLPPGLTFSNSQGTISGTPTRAGRYDGMAVTAQDSDGYQSTSQPFAMAVTDPLKISGTAPDGTAGRDYSFQYSASGGTPPYSFSVGEGSLPFGIDLAEDGTLSGTPFISGSSDGIVVRAVDADGTSTETPPFSIYIRDALAIASVPTASATRGSFYDARVEATGGVQPYRFTTVTGSFAPGLSMDGNGRISGTPTVTGDPGPVTVFVTDAEGSNASTDVRIPVVDPLSVAGTLPPGTVGQSYSSAYAAAGGAPPYSYVMSAGTLPPGLVFDGDAGTISGTPTSSGTWTGIAVKATDIDGRTATSTPANLTVSGQLQIAGTPSRAATVGQSYSASFAASGGKTPYAFSVSAGALPAGIAVDGSTGVLSGAPTTKGTSEGIQVRVVDAEGRSATSVPFGIVVSDVLTLSGTAPGTATVNSSYAAQFAAQGGRTPYSWSVTTGALPPGISVDQNGALAGTPTTPGTYSNITVAAADADGRQASSAPFSIAVASSLAVTGTPPASATTGTAYNGLFTAQGGYGAKTFSLIAGVLPQGIVLDAANGTLGGTPTTVGTASGLRVRATDSVGTTADSSVFSIDVRSPVTIASLPAGSSAVGAAYSSSASATGGRAPYLWALTAGTLPPGLSLNGSSGTVSGTPTTPGTFAGLRLRATDSDGRATTSAPFSIDVTSTLAIAGSPAPNATVGVAYSATFTSTGGSGAKSYLLASGTLPGGLSLSSAGVLSGTPSAGGQFSGLVVRVADGAGTTADSQAFSIDVRDGVAVVGLPTGSASVGNAYNSSASANGGRAPYSWSVASGTLPPGLSLGGISGALTGTPTTPGSYPGITFKAVDADGRSAVSSTFQIDVANTLVIAGSPSSISTVGSAYSATFSSSGGFGARTYSLVGGTLPAGLSLSSAGVLSGTPTAKGTSSGLVVRVTDASGTTASTPPFVVDVRDPLAIAALSPSPASVGQAYSVTPTASGGRPPLGWSLYAGSLPPGLSVDISTGAVGGTPTTPGNYNGLRLQATDADGRLAVSPAFDIAVSSTLSIAGNPPGFATVDQYYSTTFTSSGGSGAKFFSIAAGAVPAGMTLSSDGILSGNPSAAGNAADLVVRVTDGVGTSADTAPFSIDVRAAPVVAGIPSGSASVGQAYSSSASATGGRPPYAWTMAAGTLPAGLVLEGATGTVSGTPTTPGTSSNLRIRAVDADGRSATSQLFDIAVASTLAIAGTPPDTGTVGTAYSGTFTGSGGYGTRTFSMATGALPAGISLSSSGQLSGAPTASGTASGLQVRVTDASGTTATSAPFSIDVRASVSVAAVAPGPAYVGQAYALSLGASGGRSPYSWAIASGQLPPGLSLDAVAGSIGGTPTTPGSSTGLRVQATDADGRSATSSAFDIAVSSTLTISGTPATTATTGSAYSATFSASGGYGARTFSLATGVLPPGLGLSSAGVLSGTPTAVGTAAGLVVRVTDASGTTADLAPFQIDVRSALAVTATPAGNAAVGQAYSSSSTASGGRAPYSWSLQSGVLPAGLSLDAVTGTVGGTPTTPGTASALRLQVSDADGRSATSPPFDIVVSSTLAVSGSPAATATVGTPYSATFGSTGGNGAKVYSLASGTLPAGLSLSTSGTLSGTPTASGVASGLVVRVTDASSTSADTSPFSIDVRTALAVSSLPASNAATGQTYGSSASATGGRIPYAWTIAAGTLPSGLSLAAATGEISGTPTTPGSSTGIRLKVADADGRSATSAPFDIVVSSTLAVSGSPAATATVGTPYSATFTASGGYGTKTFSVATGALPAGLSLSPAGIVSGTPTSSGTSSGIVVRATDAGGTTADGAAFSIDVRSALVLTGSMAGTGAVGSPYSSALTGSGGRAPYAWTTAAGTLPAGLSLNAATGSVSGTPTTPGNSTGIRLKVADADGRSATSAPFDIAVSSTLAVSGSPATTATVGTAYSATFTATGGYGAKAFSLAGGVLPAGLTLSAAGVLSGTPTTAGTATGLIVRATDASGTTADSSTFSIDVRSDIVLAGSLAGTGAVGNVYSSSMTAGGGRSPYVWSLASGALPAGLSLDTASGTVGGTPTTPGTSTGIRLKATDADGRSATASPVDIAVSSTLAIAGSPASTATVGTVYSATFTGSGGYGARSFSLAAGTLPGGLSLSTAGVVSGTPTAAGTSTGLVVRVTDASGTTASSPAFSIDVRADMSIAAIAPPAGAVGQAYDLSPSASGGRSPYGWTLASGTLPSGLSLNAATGSVSGTPTTPGTSTGIRLKVTDADGRSATSAPFDIAVSSTLAVSGSPASIATVGTSYSAAFTATGGYGLKSFSVVAGTLPAGLSLSSSGAIGGTPNTAGTASGLVVRATDASGTSADSQAFTIDVRAALALAGTPAGTATVGSAYSSSMTASGGRTPYGWSLASGTLPSGLSLNAASGVIAGTPAAIGTSSGLTLKVTDADGRSLTSSPFGIAVSSSLAVSGSPASTASVGSAYSATFTASGGSGSKIFSLAGGTLPAGLSLSSSGILSGTPTTVGTATGLVVRVTDGGGLTADSSAFSIDVRAALSISTVSSGSGYAGSPFNLSPAASGGRSPFVWTVTSGTLPAGLSLVSGTGRITGTPRVPATASGLSLKVTDADGLTATSNTFGITIDRSLYIAGGGIYAATVGTAFSTTFTAGGGFGNRTFSLVGGTLPQGITLSSSGVVSGTPTTAGTATGLVVRVSDEGVDTIDTSSTFTIDVANPVSVATLPSGTAAVGKSYSSSATPSGGRSPYSWSLAAGTLPAGLSLTSSTGVISGTPTAAGVVTGLQLKVSDSSSRTATSTSFSIDVAAGLVAAFSPPPATYGKAYSGTVAVSGGRSPYQFAIATGSLPAGLTLSSSTGVISGTPTNYGSTSNFVVSVTDANGTTVQTPNVSMFVAYPITVTAPSSKTRVGVAYSAKGTVGGGAGSPYSWSMTGALPGGMSFDASTGTFSGTPTTVGTTSGITLTATDSAGRTGSVPVTFETVGAVTVTSGVPSASAVVGEAYSFQMSGSGGRGALYWGVYNGALPLGLTIDHNSGVISGTPTQGGTWSGVDIRAYDDDGYFGQAPLFDLVVVSPLTIVTPSPANPTQDAAYSFALTSNGGRAPLTYLVSSGGLPTGLSLSSSGVISGTPGYAGTWPNIAVKVTDAEGRTATTGTFTVTVSPGSLTATFTPPSYYLVVGGTYNRPTLQASASGGTNTFTWSLDSGALPSGLTVNSDGSITGSTTTAGAFTAALRATDTTGRIGRTASFTLNVVQPLQVSSTYVLPKAVIGRPYSAPAPTVSGGRTPYAYSLYTNSNGTLPGGLAINGTTGAITGTPTDQGTNQINIYTRVKDPDGRQGNAPININVSPAYAVGTPSAQTGTVGTSYSFTPYVAGGVSPYTWSVSGTLPPGITFTSTANGTLSGTPTTKGSYSGLTLTVTDSQGYSLTTGSFAITVK